jgi:hypothetical protein
MHTDDEKAVIFILVPPRVQVWERPLAIDARIRPEVHEDNLLADIICDPERISVDVSTRV